MYQKSHGNCSTMLKYVKDVKVFASTSVNIEAKSRTYKTVPTLMHYRAK